jgi:predicted Zn-dependent protease with MMP-like domain
MDDDQDQSRPPTPHSPDAAAFMDLASDALATIPPSLRQNLADVVFRVEEFADAETLASLGIDDAYDLLGLYQGVTLVEKSSLDLPGLPDMIFLFRQPILAFWRAGRDDLADVVRHVLIHEAGHHFGFSDADMELLEQQAEEAALTQRR